jgi:hypothetical protein
MMKKHKFVRILPWSRESLVFQGIISENVYNTLAEETFRKYRTLSDIVITRKYINWSVKNV